MYVLMQMKDKNHKQFKYGNKQNINTNIDVIVDTNADTKIRV